MEDSTTMTHHTSIVKHLVPSKCAHGAEASVDRTLPGECTTQGLAFKIYVNNVWKPIEHAYPKKNP